MKIMKYENEDYKKERPSGISNENNEKEAVNNGYNGTNKQEVNK